ncbi:MAG: hypothetical protein Q8L92_15085, partial [Rubrivivax sp.]|nr:hypothetical protein [Rubrivivax sp.]
MSPPHWTSPAGVRHELPATLPAALLIYLAAQRGAWVGRDSLAVLWWPDRSPAEALHALRITLHRLKQLLAGWGVPQGAESERQRVRLSLPCDLQRLHDSIDGTDAGALVAAPPWAWLQGFSLARADPFRAWADAEGALW